MVSVIEKIIAYRFSVVDCYDSQGRKIKPKQMGCTILLGDNLEGDRIWR